MAERTSASHTEWLTYQINYNLIYKGNIVEYAGFWRRIGAHLIDAIVLTPILALCYFLGENFRLFHLLWIIPGSAIGAWFSVYLVGRYGGTPGKLLLKLKIAMLDGSPITFRAATIRHSVLFILTLISAISLGLASLSISDELYFSLGYIERSEELSKLAPPWYKIATIGMNVWIWAEFISMLFNKKRRSIHDFMAGTVVIRSAK